MACRGPMCIEMRSKSDILKWVTMQRCLGDFVLQLRRNWKVFDDQTLYLYRPYHTSTYVYAVFNRKSVYRTWDALNYSLSSRPIRYLETTSSKPNRLIYINVAKAFCINASIPLCVFRCWTPLPFPHLYVYRHIV